MPHVLSTISFHSFPAVIEEAFRLTLLADSDPRSGRAGRKADRQASEAGMKAYMAYVLPFEQRFGILPTPEAVAAMDEMDWAEYAAGRQEPEQCDFFNLGVRRAALFRRLFFMELGYFELGPPKMQVEDRVCVFLAGGGRTPFVVRAAEEDCFKLIVEAYVHGVMDG